MIIIRGRTVQLLQFLLQQKTSVTTYQLASLFNVNYPQYPAGFS